MGGAWRNCRSEIPRMIAVGFCDKSASAGSLSKFCSNSRVVGFMCEVSVRQVQTLAGTCLSVRCPSGGLFSGFARLSVTTHGLGNFGVESSMVVLDLFALAVDA